MSDLHSERIAKEFQSMGLDCVTLLFMILDLIDASSKTTSSKIKYSKSYFSRYYGVDLETFHKWIKVFCPDLWNEDYKKKRRFTDDEAKYIIENLGSLSFDKIPSQYRKELMDKLYEDKSWRKSRRYHELCFELEDFFPNEHIKLNKLPPKLIFGILEDEPKQYDKNISDDDDKFYRSQIFVFQSVLPKYQTLSTHKKEVYRRLLRRWFSVKNKPSDE